MRLPISEQSVMLEENTSDSANICVRLQGVNCATLPCSHSSAAYHQSRPPKRVRLSVRSSSSNTDGVFVVHPHPLKVFQAEEKVMGRSSRTYIQGIAFEIEPLSSIDRLKRNLTVHARRF